MQLDVSCTGESIFYIHLSAWRFAEVQVVVEFNMASSLKRNLAVSPSNKANAQERGLHIGFLLTHGFAAHMMIRSGLAKRILNQGIRVTVISPSADEPYFQDECQAEGIMLQPAPSVTYRLGRRLKAYKSYFLTDMMNNAALKAGHGFRFEKNPAHV